MQEIRSQQRQSRSPIIMQYILYYTNNTIGLPYFAIYYTKLKTKKEDSEIEIITRRKVHNNILLLII